MVDYDTFMKSLNQVQNNQRQLDQDGIEVGVSREALENVITYLYENSFCRC